MKVYDVNAIASSLPILELARRPTHEEAMKAAPSLGVLERFGLCLARFSGQPPWERHPDDELILVIDGAMRVTVLDGDDPSIHELTTGSLVVIPAGIWHRSNAAQSVTLLAATSSTGSESSMADDPRT